MIKVKGEMDAEAEEVVVVWVGPSRSLLIRRWTWVDLWAGVGVGMVASVRLLRSRTVSRVLDGT